MRFFCLSFVCLFFFFFQAEDGIRDRTVTGVQTCALPIYLLEKHRPVTAEQARTGLTPGLPRLTDFRPPRLVLLSRSGLRVAARRAVVMPQRAGPPYPPFAVPPEHPSYLPPLRHPSPPGFCPSHPAIDASPSWSPNGSKIAFGS